MQLVTHVPRFRNPSAGVMKVFSQCFWLHQFGFFSQTWTDTDSIQQVITLFTQSRSKGGGLCHTLWGNCLLRVFNYFSCGPCCLFPLSRGLSLAGGIVDTNLYLFPSQKWWWSRWENLFSNHMCSPALPFTQSRGDPGSAAPRCVWMSYLKILYLF